MESLEKHAYGKINLGLDVLRRRPDGYHDVRMIMQTVDLYDTLIFTKRADDRILLSCDREGLPADDDNLVCRAAKLLFSHQKVSCGVDIRLVKRLPVAAGMAGGSSDAAATLRGLSELFSFGLNTEELMELGVQLGADVPFCILGGCALSEGIGEVLTPVSNRIGCELVIAKPEISVSTKYVYEHLDVPGLKRHPDIDGIRKALETGDLRGMCVRLENVLETVTVSKYGIIEQIRQELLSQGAAGALMSGSGPTVFGVFEDKERAVKARTAVLEKGLAMDVYVTRFH